MNIINKMACAMVALALPLGAAGQQCATMNYNRDQLIHQGPAAQHIEDEEQGRNTLQIAGPYIVPVVFHVIHNGEQLGFGANVSEARLQEQISILNQDFQRRNPDAFRTPADFLPVAGGMDIEFVLAKQDPEGFPTNGILRVNGGRASWDYYDTDNNVVLKALSYWPSTDYVNIWVTNLVDRSNAPGVRLLGYAQFPESDQPGLSTAPASAATDGIVLSYRSIGSISGNYRTLTHEMGHILGLFHTWGDVDVCDGEGDYINDTPTQSTATEESTCPVHPAADCGGFKMFQNYMDYTPSECQNIFTRQQIQRMRAVLENSPRRKSLLRSKGAIEPKLVANNLGLRKVISPVGFPCEGELTPRIEIKNYGDNSISSASIQLSVDGAAVETRVITFNSALATAASAEVSYRSITLSGEGVRKTFRFQILSVNGGTDGDAKNDTISISTQLPWKIVGPFLEDFEDGGKQWIVDNQDGEITWENVVNTQSGVANKSMYLNFYKYPINQSTDRLISPIIELPDASDDLSKIEFKFDWMHATSIAAASSDRLRVALVPGCSVDMSQAIELFSRSRTALSSFTTTEEQKEFIPSQLNQWKTQIFADALRRAGLRRFQIVFEGISGYGQNLYIDNVSVAPSSGISAAYRVYTNPTFNEIKVGFNLSVRQVAQIRLYDLTGHMLYNDTIYNMLDQTYVIPMRDLPQGIYIVWLTWGGQTHSTRVFFNP